MVIEITNRYRIKKKVETIGYLLGCYDQGMDKLSIPDLNKVLNIINGDSTDVDVDIRGKRHVVEIAVVDNEIDFMILTKHQYISRYGNSRWDDR